jgi:neutral trehalase
MNLSTIDTINIIPVDLNSIMYRSELTLAALIQHNQTIASGQQPKNLDDINIDDYITSKLLPTISSFGLFLCMCFCQYSLFLMCPDANGLVATYLKYAHRRYRAIQALLYDAGGVKWNDYNLTSGTQIHSAAMLGPQTDGAWLCPVL